LWGQINTLAVDTVWINRRDFPLQVLALYSTRNLNRHAHLRDGNAHVSSIKYGASSQTCEA